MNVAGPIVAAAAASAILCGGAAAQVPETAPPSTAITLLAGASGDPADIGPAADPLEATAVSSLAPPAAVAAAQYDDPWRFSVTPYVFLPTVEGQLRFNPPPANDGAPRVTIDAQDILEALDFAFMITADAHYGRFGVMTDVMYVDLGAQTAHVDQIIFPGGVVDVPLDVDTSVDFQSWVWTGAFGVEFGEPGDITIEPFLGFRYLTTEVELNWALVGPVGQFPQAGSLAQEQDSWDGVVGVRGAVSLGADSGWTINYYGDVGTGDSELTWQVVGGVGYRFGWGDLRFAWRYLAYDQGDEAFVQDLNLNGPAFGATFRF